MGYEFENANNTFPFLPILNVQRPLQCTALVSNDFSMCQCLNMTLRCRRLKSESPITFTEILAKERCYCSITHQKSDCESPTYHSQTHRDPSKKVFLLLQYHPSKKRCCVTNPKKAEIGNSWSAKSSAFYNILLQKEIYRFIEIER